MNYDTFKANALEDLQRSVGVYVIRPLGSKCDEFKKYYRCGMAGRDHYAGKKYDQSKRPRFLQSRFVTYTSTYPSKNAEIVCFLSIPVLDELIDNPNKSRHVKNTKITLTQLAELEFHTLLKKNGLHAHNEWYSGPMKNIKACLKQTIQKIQKHIDDKPCIYYSFKRDGITIRSENLNKTTDDDE
eukprot:990919-Pleurochrysis_carterae.AAC.1